MEKKGEKERADADVEGIRKCLVPGQDEWVYDYYNQQMSQRQEREFEDHLFECDRCQDVLLMLDRAYTELRLNAQQYSSSKAGAAKRRLSMKAKSSKG